MRREYRLYENFGEENSEDEKDVNEYTIPRRKIFLPLLEDLISPISLDGSQLVNRYETARTQKLPAKYRPLLHPCSAAHNGFARKLERQGCEGAFAFTQKVCKEFLDCVFKRKRSRTDINCEAKVCKKFDIVKKDELCYYDLFLCD
ncbi:hypothetical protein OESDEN_19049 [Oesophagostomum dentatum]|uniref:Uncharacterized protein n=1 Tax=Oesophagostomum dentatum TaxID=61180 RepID=A0A0B1SDI5_OESDE|nr:hypothetical protein OESDEN_19049 [Oesophagostomum dentatum]